MQKQQDIGKAHWLSKPTLVGGVSLSTPGTTGPPKRGSSAHTIYSPSSPNISTQVPLGQEIVPSHHRRGVVVPGAYKTQAPEILWKRG